jgi:hypothetical protein
VTISENLDAEHAVRAMIVGCDDEIGDAARVAVLRSEFARLLTPTIASRVIDAAQFCRAFALGAADAVAREPGLWSDELIAQLSEMCLHNGDLNAAEVLARESVVRNPRSAESIARWALAAPTAKEAILRFRNEMENVSDKEELERLAMQFAERNTDSASLIDLFKLPK